MTRLGISEHSQPKEVLTMAGIWLYDDEHLGVQIPEIPGQLSLFDGLDECPPRGIPRPMPTAIADWLAEQSEVDS